MDFDQAFSGVQLANSLLDAPLPQADAHAVHQQRQQAAAELAALQTPQALAQALRSWLVLQLQPLPGQGPGPALALPRREQAGQALGLSTRTLARRLQALQLDFSSVLDDARRDAALQAVAHSTTSLADIGQALGFAEPSTFWRAFRRWTGQTPAQWRAQPATARLAGPGAQTPCPSAQDRPAGAGRGCSAPVKSARLGRPP